MNTSTRPGAEPFYILPHKEVIADKISRRAGELAARVEVVEQVIIRMSGSGLRPTPDNATAFFANIALSTLEKALLSAHSSAIVHQYVFIPVNPAARQLVSRRRIELVRPFCTLQFVIRQTHVTGHPTLHIVGLDSRLNSAVLYSLQCAGYRPRPYGERGDWKVELV